MDKLISTEKLIHDLSGIRDTLPDIFLKNVMSAAISCVEKQPAVDTESVRHGRWLFVTKGQMTSAWCCSECGRTVVITCDEELRQSKLEKEYPFCHCGAKMDLEA